MFHKSLFDQRACHDVSLQVTLKGIATLYKLATKLQPHGFPPRQHGNDGFNDTSTTAVMTTFGQIHLNQNQWIQAKTIRERRRQSKQKDNGSSTRDFEDDGFNDTCNDGRCVYTALAIFSPHFDSTLPLS